MKPPTKVYWSIGVELRLIFFLIYAIMGPTASGKTALGVELALRVGVEAIRILVGGTGFTCQRPALRPS
ncbi:MAG TPA: hypothetical protein PLL77_12540 [Pyrinomonadaceae bacterium]|nr:hypothetical protein [Pyrinomonadaceae bacterium]